MDGENEKAEHFAKGTRDLLQTLEVYDNNGEVPKATRAEICTDPAAKVVIDAKRQKYQTQQHVLQMTNRIKRLQEMEKRMQRKILKNEKKVNDFDKMKKNYQKERMKLDEYKLKEEKHLQERKMLNVMEKEQNKKQKEQAEAKLLWQKHKGYLEAKQLVDAHREILRRREINRYNSLHRNKVAQQQKMKAHSPDLTNRSGILFTSGMDSSPPQSRAEIYHQKIEVEQENIKKNIHKIHKLEAEEQKIYERLAMAEKREELTMCELGDAVKYRRPNRMSKYKGLYSELIAEPNSALESIERDELISPGAYEGNIVNSTGRNESGRGSVKDIESSSRGKQIQSTLRQKNVGRNTYKSRMNPTAPPTATKYSPSITLETFSIYTQANTTLMNTYQMFTPTKNSLKRLAKQQHSHISVSGNGIPESNNRKGSLSMLPELNPGYASMMGRKSPFKHAKYLKVRGAGGRSHKKKWARRGEVRSSSTAPFET